MMLANNSTMNETAEPEAAAEPVAAAVLVVADEAVTEVVTDEPKQMRIVKIDSVDEKSDPPVMDSSNWIRSADDVFSCTDNNLTLEEMEEAERIGGCALFQMRIANECERLVGYIKQRARYIEIKMKLEQLKSVIEAYYRNDIECDETDDGDWDELESLDDEFYQYIANKYLLNMHIDENETALVCVCLYHCVLISPRNKIKQCF